MGYDMVYGCRWPVAADWILVLVGVTWKQDFGWKDRDFPHQLLLAGKIETSRHILWIFGFGGKPKRRFSSASDAAVAAASCKQTEQSKQDAEVE